MASSAEKPPNVTSTLTMVPNPGHTTLSVTLTHHTPSGERTRVFDLPMTDTYGFTLSKMVAELSSKHDWASSNQLRAITIYLFRFFQSDLDKLLLYRESVSRLDDLSLRDTVLDQVLTLIGLADGDTFELESIFSFGLPTTQSTRRVKSTLN